MAAVARLLAWRDKRSSAPALSAAPVSAPVSRPETWSGDLADIFLLPAEPRKKSDREKEKDKDKDKEPDNKVKTILGQLVASDVSIFRDAHIEYALQVVDPPGDSHATYDLLMLVSDSIKGHIRPINPSTKLVGAENREYVTCYLDSLLFAMFSQINCFDQMLVVNFESRQHAWLQQILRLWVNMLRSGHLITKNITRHLQNALAGCGWEDARLLAQQDVSEAFAFITEAMGLPLLTLKMDLFHTGKESRDDDHRFVNERLLDVAIPPAPEDGSSISLESCLESYFNSKVEIKRILQRRNTLKSVRSMDSEKELDLTGHGSVLLNGQPSPVNGIPPFKSFHPRSPVLFRPKSLPFESRTRDDLDLPSSRPRPDTKHKREVLMPAWQFFQLLPWFPNPKPKSDAQVAEHFKLDRPVLGICLKRYYVTPQGEPSRLETKIDIPLDFSLPHFVSETNPKSDARPLFTRFKLSLEAIICHRGKSIDAGHYVSLVRPQVRQCNGRDARGTESRWLVFDDLAPTNRVQVVDIYEALQHELPYLLFYRVVPMNGDEEFDHPPSYGEALLSAAIPVNRSSTPPADQASDLATGVTNTPHRSSMDRRSQVSHHSYSGGSRAGPGIPSASPFLSPQVPSRTPSYSLMTRYSLDERGTTAIRSGRVNQQSPSPPDEGRPGGFFSLRNAKRKKEKREREKEKEKTKDKDKEGEKQGQQQTRDKPLSSFFGRPSLQLPASSQGGSVHKNPRFFSRLPSRSADKTGPDSGSGSAGVPTGVTDTAPTGGPSDSPNGSVKSQKRSSGSELSAVLVDRVEAGSATESVSVSTSAPSDPDQEQHVPATESDSAVDLVAPPARPSGIDYDSDDLTALPVMVTLQASPAAASSSSAPASTSTPASTPASTLASTSGAGSVTTPSIPPASTPAESSIWRATGRFKTKVMDREKKDDKKKEKKDDKVKEKEEKEKERRDDQHSQDKDKDKDKEKDKDKDKDRSRMRSKIRSRIDADSRLPDRECITM